MPILSFGTPLSPSPRANDAQRTNASAAGTPRKTPAAGSKSTAAAGGSGSSSSSAREAGKTVNGSAASRRQSTDVSMRDENAFGASTRQTSSSSSGAARREQQQRKDEGDANEGDEGERSMEMVNGNGVHEQDDADDEQDDDLFGSHDWSISRTPRMRRPTETAGAESMNGASSSAYLRSSQRSRGRQAGEGASEMLEDELLADEESLPPLHIEVRLRASSTIRYDVVRRIVYTHLANEYAALVTEQEIHSWRDVAILCDHVERIWVAECADTGAAANDEVQGVTKQAKVVSLERVTVLLHIYQTHNSRDAPIASALSGEDEGFDDDDDEDAQDGSSLAGSSAASVLSLPSRSLEGVWDTLIYEHGIKHGLLEYVYSTVHFSEQNVDFNVVCWNRVVLLHGPPGTGKTSLCRALAQKLAVRLSDRYEGGKIVEINSHSLFSKWFSESGKLVQKLFASITAIAEDESMFVVVLIDEVESLTAARAGAMSGKEPSDALRVVNALLTQLDKLKHRRNVLVMTTSNLSTAIDPAFIDRADIKQYIGLPPVQAVYWILQSCIQEIMRAGLVATAEIPSFEAASMVKAHGQATNAAELAGVKLLELATRCHAREMSGRMLRRLPVLAHSRHIRAHSTNVSAVRWISAMIQCVDAESDQMDKVEGKLAEL